MARSSSLVDGHQYAPERPQREAAGQRHSRNRPGMHAHITAFEVKLGLWEAQSANGQLEHFQRHAACVPDDVEPDTCVSVVASLRKEFASRFAGVRPLAADFKLFTVPFDFPVGAPCRWSCWSYCAMMN